MGDGHPEVKLCTIEALLVLELEATNDLSWVRSRWPTNKVDGKMQANTTHAARHVMKWND